MNEETSKEPGLLQVRPEALDPQHSVQAPGDVGHSSRASRQFTTVVIDEEPQVALEPSMPGKPYKPKRRRGRPPGAKTQVAHEHVTADEFAVLRAVAQGMAYLGRTVGDGSQLQIGAGRIRSQHGGLNSPVIDISWTQSFGVGQR